MEEKTKKPKAKVATKPKEKPAVKTVKPKAAPVKRAPRAVKPKEEIVARPKEAAEVKPKRKVAVKKKEAVIVAAPVAEAKPAASVAAAPASVAAPATAAAPVHAGPVHAKPPVVEKPKVAPQPAVVAKPAPKVEPAAEEKPAVAVATKELELEFPISVKDLSVKLQLKPSALIKDLMSMRIMAGINQNLDPQIVATVCQKYGYTVKEAPNEEEVALGQHTEQDAPESLRSRAPIVTIMGHVDHGKTSILDAIRKSKVAENEHGGITQHIGAYRVKLPQGEITFLDTPGHEAFTAMRARGASVTDIVVLVVAADDGIMPQTKEAIDHSRAAGVSIIVAINKMDKAGAEPDRVKKQLNELGLVAEDWGGKTITVPVSAKTGQGIETLLEMILLEAQMLELKANPHRPGKGVVLEGKLVKSRGPVATLLIQNGTLHLNDNIIVGNYYGKVRAMFDDHRQPVVSAGPSYPVEVLGITDVALAGEQFFVMSEERQAKELAAQRQEKVRQHQMQPVKRMSLEDLYTQIKDGKLKELKLILKADAQGSLEAIKEAIQKVQPPEEVQFVILHDDVGSITASDVMLAVASQALILGFNVTPDAGAKELIDKEGQDVRVYNVIYELVNDIKAALEGMLSPKLKKVFLGRADVRKVFRLSSSGTIAGCYVTKGKINRRASIALVRNGKEIFQGELSSLKRFKDDVRDVEEGFECGMAIKGFSEVMEGDVIEAYEIQKIARTLE